MIVILKASGVSVKFYVNAVINNFIQIKLKTILKKIAFFLMKTSDFNFTLRGSGVF